MLGEVNFLLVTLDSCRWDTTVYAKTPSLDEVVELRMARTNGTFTYPAHMAMFQGILPHCVEKQRYYNRYVFQLIKIARLGAPPGGALIEFPAGAYDIARGFSAAGYVTLGWGAVGWFRHPSLTDPFDQFTFTGIHATRQVSEFISMTSRGDKPFFALINFGETHFPYQFGPGKIDPPLLSPSRRQISELEGFDQTAWLSQVACCEFLDSVLGQLFDHLRSLARPTIVVVTADHGECFGEDGLVGHGFYHPKVMDVPIGIFEMNGEHLQ